MKMQGNMALAQKFGALAEAARKLPKKAGAGGAAAAPAAPIGAGAGGAGSGFASAAVFGKISANLAKDSTLVKKVNAKTADKQWAKKR